MKTRYGLSPWISLFPDSRRPSFPTLRGEHTVDVVIMGGGLTGAVTAYACAAAGMRPYVIEAARIGQASAGRGAGLLLSEPGPAFRDVVGAHGLRAGRKIFAAWRQGSRDAATLLRRLGVKCGLESQNDLLVAPPSDDRLLRREYDARTAAGLEARWLSQKQIRQLTRLEASAAIGMRDGFVLDPYRACVGMTAAAKKRGAKFFERSQVRSVRFGKDGVEIMLAGALVRAGTIIVTTGTATAEFKPLRRHFKRRQTYFALTETIPSTIRKQMMPPGATLRDTRTPRHRLRWTDDGRMLIAGADQDEPPARIRDAVLRQRTGQLMYELLTMYPSISGLRPEYGWELTYGETVDALMYIGPHRNYPHHLFALGGGGESVTGAFLAARILLRALRGEPHKGDEVFGWTR